MAAVKHFQGLDGFGQRILMGSKEWGRKETSNENEIATGSGRRNGTGRDRDMEREGERERVRERERERKTESVILHTVWEHELLSLSHLFHVES